MNTQEDQINKWKIQMNLWTKIMEIKLNEIMQSTTIYALVLNRI